MSFGSRIKEARINKKLTQEALGKLIGVAKSTITGYEKGTSHPDEGKIIALMNVLDVDANYLWQDEMSTVDPSVSKNQNISDTHKNEKATRDDVESGLIALLSSKGISKGTLSAEKIDLIQKVVQAIVESDI